MKRTMKSIAMLSLLSTAILSGCAHDKPAAADSAFVGDQVKYQIIGIDPGAGIMNATEKALQTYDLKDWKLVEGSGAAMAAALDKAYKSKKPIIVTGWTPHWMFAKYDLKYLEDPKGVYGGDEEIHTIARNGLKNDLPSAYRLLSAFKWTPDDMAKVMISIQEGKKPEEAAAEWLKSNAAKADEWVKGIDKQEGKKIKLAYVAWDSEIASTNVIKQVLENKLGMKVELMQVEAGPMWAGISSGDVDATVAAWLPTTHKDYYDKFKGKYEDLGVNLKGTRIGLVVPSYMNIKSIEDLKKK
ncbi:glycine/betaine ABC transporter [Paenibacillus filicis]|uniref:Glycine/betaine ABC transporter n=1 Tax=Paenibacillus gyeongsangnamensis TaxID=3388067 RepID=A0ABT4Q4T1_9BACL|nr:glycine betaine ABC transporter substrate-binding protein [Paenibacillus filicis]MCZ8511792.1 glycine/betaine ABC transporter [Paenibacillus filicis]